MGAFCGRETAHMKHLRVCENLVSKRVDNRREGSKWSDPSRPIVRVSPCNWVKQGWSGGNPTIKAALCVSTVRSDSSLHDKTGEDNR